MTIAKLFNAVLVSLALSGLTYQSLELLKKFLERKTIVNIQFEMLSEHNHPAISVCVKPGTFSPFHLAHIDPEFAKAWREWENLIKGLQSQYKDKGDLSQAKRPKIQHSFKRTSEMSNALRYNLTFGNFDFDTIMSNYSLTTNDLGLQVFVDGQHVSNLIQPISSGRNYYHLSYKPIERYDAQTGEVLHIFQFIKYQADSFERHVTNIIVHNASSNILRIGIIAHNQTVGTLT